LASSPIVREESKNQLRGATDPNPGAVWRLVSVPENHAQPPPKITLGQFLIKAKGAKNVVYTGERFTRRDKTLGRD